MRRWLTVVTLAVVATAALAVVKPSPARAVDTSEIIIWSSVGAGAAVVIVLVATYFTRDDSQLFLVEAPRDLRADDESRIHFGPECRNPDGTMALLCW